MTTFFAPAVGLMNRLTYPRKFPLISVLFAVPLALVTWLLFGEINGSLDIARRQTLGLRSLAGIQPLFRAVLDQMEATVAGPSGEPLEVKRQAALGRLKDGVAALDRVNAELGDLFSTAERYESPQTSPTGPGESR